eukprot:10158167-Ditylum_brightwellii.AAC.1
MASSSRYSQADQKHQEDKDNKDMFSVASLCVSSTLESDNNCKTKQVRKGQGAPLFNLGGDPARPVYNVILASTPSNTVLTQDDQQQDKNTKNHGSVVHTPDHIDGQEAKGTIDDGSYNDETVAGKSRRRINTKNHGSVVQTPDHINVQEAEETIDDSSNHDVTLAVGKCKKDTNFH